MALPATSTPPPTPTYPHSQQSWLAEHSQPSHRNSPHGQKRRADEVDDLQDRSNNISTNFKRLRINQNILPTRQAATPPRPHDPVHPHPDSHASIASHPAYQLPSAQSLDPPSYQYQPPSQHNLHPHSHHAPPNSDSHPSAHLHPHHAFLSPNREYTNTPPPQPFLGPPSRTSTATSLSDEPMTLDHDPCPNHPPQKHKVLITDLSAELAEIEASEVKQADSQAHTFFLPDEYNKEISGVPAHVLRHQTSSSSRPSNNTLLQSSNVRDSSIPILSLGPSHDPSSSQALVLYKDPFSISVPEEEDAVRKAVSEARRRMRDKRKSESEHPSPSSSNDTTMHLHPPDADIETDHQDAEPYMRQALDLPTSHTQTTHLNAADSSTKYHNSTNHHHNRSAPLPINFQLLHNINVRQPTMSAPYISLPLPVDIDDEQGSQGNNLQYQQQHQTHDKRRTSWDEDAMDMDIE